MSFPGYFTGIASFAETTNFEEFVEGGLESTTSNGYVTYSAEPGPAIPNGFTFETAEEQEPGMYYMGWYLEYGQSDKQKQIGIRIQERLRGSGSWITLSETRETVGQDDTFNLHSGFRIIQVPVTAKVQLRFQYGLTTEGGVGRMRTVNAIIYRVGDLA